MGAGSVFTGWRASLARLALEVDCSAAAPLAVTSTSPELPGRALSVVLAVSGTAGISVETGGLTSCSLSSKSGKTTMTPSIRAAAPTSL
ncbi:MAG: hypothetical protein ACLUNV_06895 [Sutterella wadsworthensis]